MKIQEIGQRKIYPGAHFYAGDTGIIFYDHTDKRYIVKFKDDRVFYIADILKDWLDNNSKEKYQSPFDGEIK